MRPDSKLCLCLSILVPIVYLFLANIFGSCSGSILLDAVVVFCVIPTTVSGAWLWFSDTAGLYLNGFPNLKEEYRTRAANLMGIGVVLFGFVMSLGLGLLLSEGNIYGIIIILLALIFVLVPILYFNERKIRNVRIPLEKRSPNTKGAVIVLISILVLLPLPVLGTLNADGNEIAVTFREDSFSVKGPMFDHTFHYKDVDVLALEENFEKGKRIYGYATSKLCSGKFNNSMFGGYYLASYTKVIPCIVFSVDGTMYAFNQADISKTQQTYNMLYDKVQTAI